MKINIEDKIKSILEEDLVSSSNTLLEKNEKDLTKEEVLLNTDKIRFINDTRSRAIPEGKTEDFKKVCSGDPRELSSKELDTKFKAALKWAEENLDQKQGLPTEPNELENKEKKTKKENIMSDNKPVIKEATAGKSDSRIQEGYKVFQEAIRLMQEASNKLQTELNYHFMQLGDKVQVDPANPASTNQLTAIDTDLANAVAKSIALVKKFRELLK